MATQRAVSARFTCAAAGMRVVAGRAGAEMASLIAARDQADEPAGRPTDRRLFIK